MDYKVTDTQLSSIANAIRSAAGTSEPMAFPSDFISAISDMVVPSGNLSISQNGTYDVSAFAGAVVDVAGGGSYSPIELESGGFNNSGLNIADSARLRSIGFIPCQADADYLLKVVPSADVTLKISVSYYTTDDYTVPRIGYTSFENSEFLVFTPPNNTAFFRVLIAKRNGASVTTDDVSSCEYMGLPV